MSKEVRRVVRQFMLVVLLAFWSAHALAQSSSVSPEDELKKKIKVSEETQPLGESPLGESISLYNGSLRSIRLTSACLGRGRCCSFVGVALGAASNTVNDKIDKWWAV